MHCILADAMLPPKVRFADILVVEELTACACLDDIADLEDVGAVGDGERLLSVLLNEKDGRAERIYLLYHIKDGVYVEGREAHTGLIE